jgi:ribonuclease G
MAKNILVISCDLAETRVALIENGIIAELHIERRGAQPRGGAVGDIYLGKVTRVLPGLQAAFVDIGLERAAFLHVEDLIRPDDFETYLAGGRKHALGAGGGNGAAASAEDTPDESDVAAAEAAEAEVEIATPEGASTANGEDAAIGAEAAASVLAEQPGELPPIAAPEEARELEDEEDEGAEEEAEEEAVPADRDSEEQADAEHTDEDGDEDEDAPSPDSQLALPPESSLSLEDAPTATGIENPESEPPPPERRAAKTQTELAPLDELLDDPNLPGFTVSDPGEPMPRAPAPRLARRDDRGGGDRGRGRRRRGRGRDRDRDRDRDKGRGGREGDRGGHREHRTRTSVAPGRLSKSTPIRDVVKEGQEIIVQITKEPISTKGARCSSHISLPGRYVVYLPTLEHVGVSKRIGSDKERARLRETIDSMKPPTGGLIVRTVAEGLTKKQLKQDVGYLVRCWGEVA